MKKVLITGATSGIGAAAARAFHAAGWQCIITGRRAERLQQLAGELQASALAFDVSDEQATKAALDSLLPTAVPDVIINNAGKALGKGNFAQSSIADWQEMIDVNVKGLLYVSHWAAQHLARGSHIINVGSLAGREVYPNGHVYCATKHAVDAITKGMRQDLLPKGIKVGQVAPAMTETEFSIVRFHGDEAKAKAAYEGFAPLTAQDIADTLLWMVSAPAHVNIADVLILPTAQATSTIVHKS